MMRVQDTLRLATRMFRTRPARTWLTILGIGVGIAAVVVLVGLGYGLQGIFKDQIVLGDAMLSLNVNTPSSRTVMIDKEKIAEFKKLENVDDVAPLASFTAQAKFGEVASSVMLNGVEAKYFKYAGVVAKNGELFKQGDNDSVVISSAMLKLFELEPEQIIGQKLAFKVFLPQEGRDEAQEMPLNKDYTIIGVIEDAASIFAYISIEEFNSNFVIPFYEKARVKVSDQIFLNPVEAKLIEKGFLVSSLSKTVDQANKIFTGIQVMLALFGGIALIVSAIGMFNTMTVTLLERTKEIGIMRTIGGSPIKIKVMFLTESILMGTLGGLSGIAIGVSGGWIVNFLLNIVATKMGGVGMKLFAFPASFLTFIAVFSMVMGYLTGLFPSKRAGSLNPLDAIRS